MCGKDVWRARSPEERLRCSLLTKTSFALKVTPCVSSEFCVSGLGVLRAGLATGDSIFTRRACSLLAGGLLGGGLLGVDLLAHELADGKGSLLSVDHHGEALEVVQVGALSLGRELLGNVGGGPLFADLVFLPGLLDSTRAGTAVKGNLNFGELESAEGVEGAGELALLALDKDSLAISPVNNEHGLAVVFTEVNKSKSSSLNKESKRLKNVSKQIWGARSGSGLSLALRADFAAQTSLKSVKNVPFLLLYYYIK